MDNFFDFVKHNPAVMALLPASIQAIVSLLTLFKKKSESKIVTYSNNNYGNQINAGAYSTNKINDYSNSGNTTINNNQTYNSTSSSNTSISTVLVYLILLSIAAVIVLCFYLENRDIILTSVFIFVFTSYILNLLLAPKIQRLIVKTIIYFILTALCCFLISYNYFKPYTFDAYLTQISNTNNFSDKYDLVLNNHPALYYVLLQISALLFLSISPLYDIVNNIRILTSSNSGGKISPIIGVIVALICVLLPAILPYYIPSW
ncbi:hypothetical protein [Lacrimispora amygdalina]|uniref:hypothetical protein n=1 Tax=Lacrimispora amygdalina TaxID=253257 RepID=UPI000BE2A864|nr:hypothetical protein [Lacrimispora amygdalina]